VPKVDNRRHRGPRDFLLPIARANFCNSSHGKQPVLLRN
jgi:hypothetical protein